MKTSLVRWLTLTAVVALGAALLPSTGAAGFPVASDAARYAACGRVFPDPHAYWPSPAQAPNQSPWAKGNGDCKSTDFLGWDETLAGLNFLASDDMFGDFVEVYDLSQENGRFADVLDLANGEGKTAGLPTEDMGREQVPMYLVRVTDEEDTGIPIDDRKHFAYALSIHGIERAGIEGGIRAIEDLATWASCEKHGDADSAANCARENAGPENPHPILETMPDESLTAGAALRQSSVWFVLSNPDGWRRGDKQEGGFFYQRYNGNGMDMNRDWPTTGYTFRPYTPWSEPETRAVGKALQDVKEKWTAGIDLHGQLIDRAFSFTLIGGSERPFDKDRRVLQFTKGAWQDAEERLAWNQTLIKPNDAPESDPRMYGVQWGTIWDTIDYTVTGAMGDWMDSPIGLDSDGIDNEMSLSHLSNCGVGTCYIPDAEQLHVDGNKSLIYAQLHYSLEPEDTTFGYAGRAAYLYNPQRVSHPGDPDAPPPAFTALPQQETQEFTIEHLGGETVEPFEVKGPDQGIYNGGIRATITWNNAQGVSLGSLNEIAIDKRRSDEEDPDRGEQEDDEWQTQNTYFNQSFVYAQSGAQIDVNSPTAGTYRVRVNGDSPSQFHVKLEFLDERAWPDPGQAPYDVSNMDFFSMLRRHVPVPTQLVRVPVADVLSGKVDLRRFDTVVAADDAFLPGYRTPEPAIPAQKDVNGTVNCACAPGAGVRTSATSAYFEFDVEKKQSALDARVTSATIVDPDLYLQKKLEDGTWSSDVASGGTGRSNLETLNYASPEPGRYRLEVHNWAGSPGPAEVAISFTGVDEVKNPSSFTNADRNMMAGAAKSFVEQGGNLVLTDNSLQALEWMGVTGEDSVAEQLVYAGHVQFSADGGETATYDDPLAQNVNQPGAAEGSGHRHQVAEPVPTGFAIQDETGGDRSTHPQWSVDRAAFDAAKGRVVGMIGDKGVTLGELEVGDGVVRILGSLLPVPTEEFDHPYGLSSYAITYSGYEVLRNLMDWTNPNGALAPPTQAACDSPQVPTGEFNDIGNNAHEGSIECIAWYGITTGTSRTRYSPAADITRGQMATFIANLAVESGLRLPKDPPNRFNDDDGSIHEYNINALAEMELIKGTSHRGYEPKASVSRAQMATFIAAVHKAATGSLPEPAKDYFGDDNGNTHEGSVNALADLGVVVGRADADDSDGDGDRKEVLYFPAEAVSRAQMASFIVHDLGLHVIEGVAYFGGAKITLRSTTVERGGELEGQVVSNKRLRGLTATGCGYSGDEIVPRTDGSFTIDIEDNDCTIAIRVTSRRVGASGDGQTVRYRFPLTVTNS